MQAIVNIIVAFFKCDVEKYQSRIRGFLAVAALITKIKIVHFKKGDPKLRMSDNPTKLEPGDTVAFNSITIFKGSELVVAETLLFSGFLITSIFNSLFEFRLAACTFLKKKSIIILTKLGVVSIMSVIQLREVFMPISREKKTRALIDTLFIPEWLKPLLSEREYRILSCPDTELTTYDEDYPERGNRLPAGQQHFIGSEGRFTIDANKKMIIA